MLQAVLDGASEPTSNTAGVLRHNPSGMDFSIQLFATNQCVYPADQIRSAGADIISVIVLSTYVSIFLQVRNSACRGGHLWLVSRGKSGNVVLETLLITPKEDMEAVHGAPCLISQLLIEQNVGCRQPHGDYDV